MTTAQNPSTSTSAEVIENPKWLAYADLGKTVAVRGKDVTLGEHGEQPTEQFVGRLDTLRMAPDRMVAVITSYPPGLAFGRSRVIVLELPGG